MLDANEHAATKNMRPYFEIVLHGRKTRTNGSPGNDVRLHRVIPNDASMNAPLVFAVTTTPNEQCGDVTTQS